MKPSAFGLRLTRQPALLLGLLGLFWFGAACSNMALGEVAPATMALGEMAPALWHWEKWRQRITLR